MKAILDDLNAVSGVTGSFVCDGEGHILISALKAPISDEVLSLVAKTISRTADGGFQRKKAIDVQMVFESGVLVLKALDPGCLCIVCSSLVNIPMLNLTANMAVRQLKKAMPGAPAPAPQAPSAGGGVIPAERVTQVEHELAVAVGPVAMLMVDETLGKLHATRTTLSEVQVPAFLERLAADVADSARRRRFLDSAKRILAR